MSDSRCERCQWWVRLRKGMRGDLVTPLVGGWLTRPEDADEPKEIGQYGQCRRMPPSVSTRTSKTEGSRQVSLIVSEFPDTPFDAWCGEFTNRRDEPAQFPAQGSADS